MRTGGSSRTVTGTLHKFIRRVTNLRAPPFWVCILLGLVMILAGFFVLGDVMLVTVISTIFIGWVAIIAGAFEIVHAFWTKGWGGFVWQVLLGILYVAFGVVLVGQPVASALILTYVLGLLLLVSVSCSASATGGKPAGSCCCQACSASWPASSF